MLVALAAYLAEERSDEVSYPRFLGGLIIVGIAGVAVIVQPDIGTASVLVAMAMGVLLVAGAKARYIAAYTFLALATVAAALIGRLVNDYQLDARPRAARREQPRPGDPGGVVPGEPRPCRRSAPAACSARDGSTAR